MKAPLTRVTPVATIIAPAAVGASDSFKLKGKASGLTSRGNTYTWNVVGGLSGFPKSGSELTIPAGALSASQTYSFTLIVTNFFGDSSASVTADVFISPLAIPIVTILNDLPISATRGSPLKLYSKVGFSASAGNSDNLTLEWSYSTSTNFDLYTVLSSVSSSLTINTGSMTTGVYRYKINATSTSGTSNYATVDVEIKNAPIVASLNKGDFAITKGSDITLSATYNSGYTYSWSATENGVAALTSELSSVNTNSISVGTSSLSAGVYVITVVVGDGVSTVSLTSSVTISEIPIIAVAISPLSSYYVNPSSRIILSGRVLDATYAAANVSWIVNSANVDLTSSILSAGPNGNDLIFNPSVLNAGVKYSFTFEAVLGTVKGSAVVEFVTVGSPAITSYTVTTADGHYYQYTSAFNFATQAVDMDVSLPLTYKYTVIESTGIAHQLSGASPDSEVTSYLAYKGQLAFEVTVTNNFGASSTARINLLVETDPSLSLQQASQNIANQASRALSSGDSGAYFSSISALGSIASASLTDQQALDKANELIAMLSALNVDNVDQDFVNMKLSALLSAINNIGASLKRDGDLASAYAGFTSALNSLKGTIDALNPANGELADVTSAVNCLDSMNFWGASPDISTLR